MKTFKELRENTDAAVKAFLAKGGKIKKLAPGKAQGYHGKDDPGKDVKGMMDKGDTKAVGTRKKVKSMESAEVKEISKTAKGNYIKKAADDMARSADVLARADRNTDPKKVGKASRNFVNRRKGIAKAVESTEVKEISKKTLGNYVKKATADVDDKAYTQGQADGSGTDANYNRTLNKRRRGINKAVNRLMK